jgi:two-component system response regulator HydG
MCRAEVVEPDHLPAGLSQGAARPESRAAGASRLSDQERQLIQSTLEKVGWNKYRAAQILGVARSTLYSKIAKYGIKPPAAAREG